ncbi:hypothetical protein NFI96_033305 [Prochilodus magdalenae]|nr:hypothetical protein NFI96_033305 [Prochilodus magdalenae]
MVTCDSESSIRHTVCTVVLQLSQPTNLCCTECIVNTPRINSTLRAQVLQIQINASLFPEEKAEDLLDLSKNVSALNITQIEKLVTQLYDLLSVSRIDLDLGNKSINIVSNLLNTSVNMLDWTLNRTIIDIVDRVGLILELESEKQNQTMIFPNVALAVLRVNGSDFKNTSFIIKSSSSQINFVFISNETVDGPVQSSIDLPGSLMDNISNKSEASRIQFVYFQKSTLFQDRTLVKGEQLIGGVLGCSVANLSLSSLTDSVTITFSNTEPLPTNATVSCVFWNTSLNNGSGGWSSSGCTVVNSTTTETKCSCNHLTYFSRMACDGTNVRCPCGSSEAEHQADQLLAEIKDVSSLTASQVAKFVSQLEKLLSGHSISQGLANTSVNIVSKLMNAPQEALKSSSGRMVEIVEEKVGTKVVMQNETKVIQSPSVVLTVMNMTSNPPQEMTLNSTEQDTRLNPESGLVSGVLGLSVANMSTIINISNLDYNVTIRLGTTHVSVKSPSSLVLTYITYFGCSLSAIFLFITLLTYLAFEKLHKDIPSRILIQFSLALLLLNVVFLLDLALAQKLSAADLCITAAFFLHYFLLATFTWMALQAFYMYLTIVKVFNTNFSRFMIKLGLAGWAASERTASCVCERVVTVELPDPWSKPVPCSSLPHSCWFTKDPAFYASVMAYFCVTFLLTSGMFIVLMVLLCRMKSRSPQNTQQRTAMQDFKSVTALAVFLGLTWVFAFFAWGPLNQPFTYLFTICNSFQGKRPECSDQVTHSPVCVVTGLCVFSLFTFDLWYGSEIRSVFSVRPVKEYDELHLGHNHLFPSKANSSLLHKQLVHSSSKEQLHPEGISPQE